MGRLCGGLVAVLVCLGVSPACASTLCKSRTGAMMVRDACKRKETPIDLVQFGPTGAQGTAGATGTAGFPAVLRDANNAFVGTILDDPSLFPTTSTRALRTVEGQVVSFAVDATTGFTDNASPFVVYYEHPGCTGRLFVLPVLPNQLMFSEAFVHGGIAFYPVDASELHPVVSLLTFTTMGSCSGTFTAPDQCCVPTSGSPLVAQAKTFALGTLGLVPPFHADVP